MTPAPHRPPTVAEAFFRTGFGCASAIVMKIVVVGAAIFVSDCRNRERVEQARRLEAERAVVSTIAARLADELARGTDPDGRFVRKPEGDLPDADAWGRSFRLVYRSGRLSDGLEVRSAGPDGQWGNHDDVVVTRESKVSAKALTRDAASGLLDAVKKRPGKAPAADAKDARE